MFNIIELCILSILKDNLSKEVFSQQPWYVSEENIRRDIIDIDQISKQRGFSAITISNTDFMISEGRPTGFVETQLQERAGEVIETKYLDITLTYILNIFSDDKTKANAIAEKIINILFGVVNWSFASKNISLKIVKIKPTSGKDEIFLDKKIYKKILNYFVQIEMVTEIKHIYPRKFGPWRREEIK